MSKETILFEEKQFLGHNRFSIVVRTTLTIFCFLGYYWSENPKPVQLSFVKIGSYPIQDLSNSGLVFFILGLSILVLSAALTYVLHTHIVVRDDIIVLDGFWTSRRVVIHLSNVVSIRRSRYKKNIWRRAVYNLHNRGTIRFYTSGENFIELTDNKGYTYKIGSQKSEELYKVLQAQIKDFA